MLCSSPARHISSERRHVVPPGNRWTAVAVLALGVVVAATACSTAVSPVRADDLAGPAWRTDERRSPGAATRTSPATLTGVSVQPFDTYDRVVFAFDGDRPGYRVAYDDRAGDQVLTVTINHVEGPREQRLTPHTEAVAEIVQHPDRELVTDIVIELTDGAADVRPVFRVGLDVGSFYVDIGHPDRITPAAGDDPARTAVGHGGRTGHGAGIG